MTTINLHTHLEGCVRLDTAAELASEIGVTPSAVTSPGDGETAYWTAARTAYALSGGRDHAGLGDAARRLAGQGATKL